MQQDKFQGKTGLSDSSRIGLVQGFRLPVSQRRRKGIQTGNYTLFLKAVGKRPRGSKQKTWDWGGANFRHVIGFLVSRETVEVEGRGGIVGASIQSSERVDRV